MDNTASGSRSRLGHGSRTTAEFVPTKQGKDQYPDGDTGRHECLDQGECGEDFSSTKPETVDDLDTEKHELMDGEWGKGAHEVEHFQHESDLHDKMKNCKKNPGHPGFIPVEKFNIEHLPEGHCDLLVWNFIQTVIFLTVRLVVRYTSEDRPDGYCDSDFGGSFWPRGGTGMVHGVYNKFTENGRCPCGECKKFPNKAKTRWGAFCVLTAKHVVFNDEECEHTRCDVGFDREIDKDKCDKLEGWKVNHSDIEWDYCRMLCITHDENVYNKMKKMVSCYHDLRKKLRDKYDRSEYVALSKVPVLIVSHPHGLSKHVSVGVMTSQQKEFPWAWGYNTDSCPGSSGSGVFRLGWSRDMWDDDDDDYRVLYGHHAIHSRCKQKGENQSGHEGFWFLL